MLKVKQRKVLVEPYRKGLLCSGNSILYSCIAGPPPLDLVLQESTAEWKIKRRLRQDIVVEARQRTLKTWQEKWDIADTERHIYATIPPIELETSAGNT